MATAVVKWISVEHDACRLEDVDNNKIIFCNLSAFPDIDFRVSGSYSYRIYTQVDGKQIPHIYKRLHLPHKLRRWNIYTGRSKTRYSSQSLMKKLVKILARGRI